MKLIADEIVNVLTIALRAVESMQDDDPLKPDPVTATLWNATGLMAAHAQTILFPSAVLLGIVDGLSKFDGLPVEEMHLPFDNVCLQFDKPLRAKTFLSDEVMPEVMERQKRLGLLQDDWITAILLFEDRDTESFRAALWYASGAVNHARWTAAIPDPVENQHRDITAAAAEDKRQIKRMAQAAVTFINSKVTTLDYVQQAAPAANAKRRKQGKRELKPYYICAIRHAEADAVARPTGTGRRQSLMYAVRGHVRHLASGKVIWVIPHYRGLAYADKGVTPKIYKEKGYEPPK